MNILFQEFLFYKQLSYPQEISILTSQLEYAYIDTKISRAYILFKYKYTNFLTLSPMVSDFKPQIFISSLNLFKFL